MRHQIVFVYGSLLSGENHHSFLGGAKPLGEAMTEPVFSLVDFGDFAALIPDGQTAVHGELYDVDPGLLARLDELEDHPDYLRRTNIRLEDGREVIAYLLSSQSALGQPRIECGNWRLRGQARRGA